MARELFARKGMENTTMNDIAVASKCGRRTLYTYFRNKEEIYYAVIESELELLSDDLDRVATMDAEPEQKLLQLLVRLILKQYTFSRKKRSTSRQQNEWILIIL